LEGWSGSLLEGTVKTDISRLHEKAAPRALIGPQGNALYDQLGKK
jgi:hypothetical protein